MIHHHPFSSDQMARVTAQMNVLNNFDSAVKGNLKIKAEQDLLAAIENQRQYIATQPPMPLDYAPHLQSSWNIIHSLPESLQQIVAPISQATGFDHLTVTIAVLSAISTALCGRFKICLTPTWQEIVSLYALIVAPSGSRKSALINLIKHPLLQAMKEKQAEYDKYSRDAKRLAKEQQKAIELARNLDIKDMVKSCRSAGVGSNYRKLVQMVGESDQEVAEVEENIRSKIPPARPNLFIGNFTESGLFQALFKHGEYQASMEDEGGLIDNIITIGKRFNIDLILNAYDQTSNFRTTGHNEIYLNHPSLNLLYALQPEIAAKFFRKNSDKKRGLPARFMTVFAHQGHTCSATYTTEVVSDFSAYYGTVLKSILNLNYTQERHRQIFSLEVEPGARAELENFNSRNLWRIQNGQEYMESFLSKLHGMACRMAGVLHLWGYYSGSWGMTPITIQTVCSAITVAEALIPHADHAYRPTGMIATETAERLDNHIRSARLPYVKPRDARNDIGRDLSMKEVLIGFERLRQYNRVAELFDHTGARIYVVHPALVPWHIISPIAMVSPSSPMLPSAISQAQSDSDFKTNL